MSAPFVAGIRSRPAAVRLAAEGAPTIAVRVEMPEVWDVVRFDVTPNEPATSLKLRALDALAPGAKHHEDYVLKLAGWEVLDENAPLAEIGVKDGSILLVTNRRKRPVRTGA